MTPAPISAQTSDDIAWVTGGSEGLGRALIEAIAPRVGRVINISRRAHPSVENVIADLSTPEGWEIVRAHLRTELADFSGRRAFFIHNAASLNAGTGWAGTVDPLEHERHVLMNVAAPVILGEAFFAATPVALDAGIVMISSSAATSLPLTRAAYGAGKAALEQWVRTVHEERRRRGSGPWAVAVIPGGIDTPGLRTAAATDDTAYPRAQALRDALTQGLMQDPAVVARAIWSLLPPDPDSPPVVRIGPSHAVPESEYMR